MTVQQKYYPQEIIATGNFSAKLYCPSSWYPIRTTMYKTNGWTPHRGRWFLPPMHQRRWLVKQTIRPPELQHPYLIKCYYDNRNVGMKDVKLSVTGGKLISKDSSDERPGGEALNLIKYNIDADLFPLSNISRHDLSCSISYSLVGCACVNPLSVQFHKFARWSLRKSTYLFILFTYLQRRTGKFSDARL